MDNVETIIFNYNTIRQYLPDVANERLQASENRYKEKFANIKQVLTYGMNYAEFKNMFQFEAIMHMMNIGKFIKFTIITFLLDNSLIFFNVPTETGKTLPYVLMAAYECHNCSLVVLPSIPLIHQLASIVKEDANLTALKLCSETSQNDINNAVHLMITDEAKFLKEYQIILTTPEKCFNENIKSGLGRLHELGILNRIIIDEAHMAFHTTVEFRPEYGKIFNVSWNFIPISLLKG
uniref:Helicase ATP-binding domain-containing protein n=1 Tax=Strongyloides papillosus TaxID=174720 RepID=A0A0N5CGU7_STREA